MEGREEGARRGCGAQGARTGGAGEAIVRTRREEKQCVGRFVDRGGSKRWKGACRLSFRAVVPVGRGAITRYQ